MSKSRYSGVAIVLHWLVAIGILYNLYCGVLVFGDNTPRSAIDLHKSVGITVLGLALLRVLWRIGHKPPAPLPGLRPWERILSTAVHHSLYLLMVLVPLVGWLHDSAWKAAASHPLVLFNTIPFFRLPLFNGLAPAAKDQAHELLGNLHSLTAWILLGAVGLHLAGALKHQLLDRQPLLRRMWFGGR